MKKFLVVATVLIMSVAATLANQVQWWVPYGMFDHEATDLVDVTTGDGIMNKYDVLWQLIYAGPNQVADEVVAGNPGLVSGDDEVIGSRLLSQGDATFDNWLYTDNTDATSIDLPYVYSETDPYYVFQRVYESSEPVKGTYYYQSDLVLLGTDYDTGLQNIPLSNNFDSGTQPNLVVGVPEPATMSLLGLGALAMVLRRKLRK